VYCKLKEEALDITVGRTRFERGCGSAGKRDCRKNDTLTFILKWKRVKLKTNIKLRVKHPIVM
jgi:hypothetical protein